MKKYIIRAIIAFIGPTLLIGGTLVAFTGISQFSETIPPHILVILNFSLSALGFIGMIAIPIGFVMGIYYVVKALQESTKNNPPPTTL